MIDLKRKKIGIFGLSRSGKAALQFLTRFTPSQILVFDKTASAQDEEILALQQKITFQLVSKDFPLEALKHLDVLLVTSSGDAYSKYIAYAIEQKLQVISLLYLACQFIKAPIIAVTGTNGKTTTAHFIKQGLELAGKKVLALGGNFGPYLQDFNLLNQKVDYALLELSSTYLKHSYYFHPHIAVLLNVYAGHAERHPNFEDYAQTKAKIFSNQTSKDFLIHQTSQTVSELIVHNFCLSSPIGFAYGKEIKKGVYFDAQSHQVVWSDLKNKDYFNFKNTHIQSPAQMECLLAATAVLKKCNLTHEKIEMFLAQAKGLPHRLEYLGKVEGVDFYNDARAVNVASTMMALATFPLNSVILIAGGDYKERQNYESLIPLLKSKVACLILMGEKRRLFLEKWGSACPTFTLASLEDAFELARKKMRAGAVVLLSPACPEEAIKSSTNLERGEQFRKMFEAIKSKGRKLSPLKI